MMLSAVIRFGTTREAELPVVTFSVNASETFDRSWLVYPVTLTVAETPEAATTVLPSSSAAVAVNVPLLVITKRSTVPK